MNEQEGIPLDVAVGAPIIQVAEAISSVAAALERIAEALEKLVENKYCN